MIENILFAVGGLVAGWASATFVKFVRERLSTSGRRKEAGPGRRLLAIGLGSLTVIVAMMQVAALGGFAARGLGASQSVVEWVMLACAGIVGAWLSPMFFVSRASRAVYGFWLRHVAGVEW